MNENNYTFKARISFKRKKKGYINLKIQEPGKSLDR